MLFLFHFHFHLLFYFYFFFLPIVQLIALWQTRPRPSSGRRHMPLARKSNRGSSAVLTCELLSRHPSQLWQIVRLISLCFPWHLSHLSHLKAPTKWACLPAAPNVLARHKKSEKIEKKREEIVNQIKYANLIFLNWILLLSHLRSSNIYWFIEGEKLWQDKKSQD